MDTACSLWSTIEHCLEENLMFLPQREELLVALLYELYKPDKKEVMVYQRSMNRRSSRL